MGNFERDNIVYSKSYNFGLRIVNAYLFLSKQKQEYVLSKQLLRSGTAIGALISESEYAQSKADFINKMSVALKEANETKYWINLLHDSKYLSDKMYLSIFPEIEEIVKLLTSIINTSKKSIKK